MPILGIDLGKHRFRVVELEQEKNFFVLNNYGNYAGPALELNFNSPEDIARYANEVKKFIADNSFTTSHAVVALPEQDVFIRVIKTPVMSEKELNNFILLGAEEYIPIPVTEVTFDAQIIEKRPEDMSVLLVASKNEVLNRYVEVLKKAGLTPKGLEPETLSIERVLGDTADRPSASIIVNIGIAATQLIITYKGFVRFTRSVPIGGDALTSAIQKQLNLEFDRAEEYKKAYGLDEAQVEAKVHDAIKPVFDSILLEINKSKMYYTTHNPDVIINRVILSGGTALMPGLLLYIANKLDVEAELANPWRTVKLIEKLKGRRNELIAAGPLYSTAVGLAMKKV